MKRGHLVLSVALTIAVSGGAACGGRVEDSVDGRALAVATEAPASERPQAPTRPPREGDEPSLSSASDPCPDRPPSDLDWCPRPYKCRYPDSCSQRPPLVASEQAYECVASRWTRVSSKYPVACPKDPPKDGAPCEIDCAYPSPCAYETACGRVWATCELWNGSWHSTGTTCGTADAGD